MGKTIDPAVLPYLYKQGTLVVTLYEIGGTYKYVANNENVSDYTALAIKRDTIKSEEGTIISELEIGLDNVDLGFRTLVMNGGLEGLEVIVKLGFCTITSGGSIILQGTLQIFQGVIDEPKGDEQWLTVTLRPNSILEREFPRRIYQENCNWIFCDSACGLSITDYQVNTTVSVDATGTVFTCTHGKPDNYFVPGFIEIMSESYVGNVRPILSNNSSSVTVRIPFDGTIVAGTLIKLQKLCDKTTASCETIFSNNDNFGGFPYLPSSPIF